MGVLGTNSVCNIIAFVQLRCNALNSWFLSRVCVDKLSGAICYATAWFVLLLACSCSTIETGRYLVAQQAEAGIALPESPWRTYGLAPFGAGAPRKMTADASIGRKRPLVFKHQFEENLHYILYPIIVRERLIFVGPPIITLFPVWFLDTERGAEQACHIFMTWYGNIATVEHISVFREDINGKRSMGKRVTLAASSNELECAYVFDGEFVDGDDLILQLGHAGKRIRLTLSSRRGIEWLPSIRFINGPRYPATYPGQRTIDNNEARFP